MSFALGIPREFKYVKVNDLNEAFDYLEEGGKILAGGQSLLPLLKLRIVNYDRLVDITNLNLRSVRVSGDKIIIGSLTTHNEVASKVKILSKPAFTIADLQVRNRGTIGGSLAQADPSANYFPALLTLNAEIIVRSKKGERIIPIKDFYKSPYNTELKDNELITNVVIPFESPTFKFEIYKRGGSSYPTVIIAVGIYNKTHYKISFGGLTERPLLFEGEVEKKTKDDIISKIREEKILSDTHADSNTRLKIAERLFTHAFDKALNGESDYIEIPQTEINWKSKPIVAEGKTKISMKVNDLAIEDEVEPRTLLLDFLRKNGYKEIKRGCDEGKCGACTVIANGRAIKSCLTLAVQMIGQDIRTVKGLNDIEPLKRSFVNNFAMQCGYCTHGFLMATYDYLKNIRSTDKDKMRYSIKNICRCTGYFNIIKAINEAHVNQ